MLVPEAAQGAASELAALRAHCDAVVRRIVDAAGAGGVTVVGSAPEPRRWNTTAGGSLRGFGVDVHAGGADTVLTPGLTIGAWLLDRAGWDGERRYAAVSGARQPLDLSGPVLVMADGTAKRSDTAPGHVDERAPAYDKTIAEALATGDPAALAALDLWLGERLWAGGAPAFRSVGGSVVGAGRTVHEAQLHYDAAPYGVGYFVAEWWLDGDRPCAGPESSIAGGESV